MALTNMEKQYSSLVRAQVGKRYILGYEVSCKDPSPKAFDCSELVEWSYCRTGVTIRDLAAWQYQDTHPVVGELKVGDLCFLKNNPRRPGGIGHVGIVVGDENGNLIVVEAKGRAYGVVRSTITEWRRKSTFAGFRRYDDMAEKLRAKPYEPCEVVCVHAKKGKANEIAALAKSLYCAYDRHQVPCDSYPKIPQATDAAAMVLSGKE